MLRGVALAILLLNLVLLMWGGIRSGPDRAAVGDSDRMPASALPTLVLLDSAGAHAAGASLLVEACMRFGPLSADQADALMQSLAALGLTGRPSRDRDDGTWIDVGPGRSSSEWPESDLLALADGLAVEVSACDSEDLIAPEPSRP